ncbi:MAG: hypothetical protein WA988_12500 [Candidatus Nanopelagicales bacterium]
MSTTITSLFNELLQSGWESVILGHRLASGSVAALNTDVSKADSTNDFRWQATPQVDVRNRYE